MLAECQRIKNYRAFITALLIYHKLPMIARSLAPRSLPDHSQISPPIASRPNEAVMSNFFLASEAANLNLPSKIAFPDHVPSSVHEFSKIFLSEDISG